MVTPLGWCCKCYVHYKYTTYELTSVIHRLILFFFSASSSSICLLFCTLGKIVYCSVILRGRCVLSTHFYYRRNCFLSMSVVEILTWQNVEAKYATMFEMQYKMHSEKFKKKK